jgi:electron-transferring-flavoprotein dehydrogenase
MTERDVMEFDVVIVGGGPAGLATAIHLGDLLEQHNAAAADDGKLEPEIVLIEKGKEIGSHGISGAVMDPRAMDQLLPEWRDSGAPVESQVTSDAMLMLSENGGFKVPLTPPPLRNHGKTVVSLNRLVRWMGEQAEAKGVEIFPGFPGAELTRDGDRVTGVQLADAGLDKNGAPKSAHEPGAILRGKCVVLCEGSRGSMTKQLVADLNLEGQNPQVYAIGVKEVWEVPAGQCPPGTVVHTLGYPLKSDTFGGGWVYGMGRSSDGKDLVSIGLVVGLDYKDPALDPHYEFQRHKLHPKIRPFLEGGKMLHYGAKSLPEGGLFSMPRLYGDGFLIGGDAGGFLNGMRLKGIHLAIRSGMLAAETIFEELKAGGDFSAAAMKKFDTKFRADWSYQELRTARNFHQGFHGGRLMGLIGAAFNVLFGGLGAFFRDNLKSNAGHTYMQTLAAYHGGRGKPQRQKLPEDGVLTFDKLTDVYSSGTEHEEDQPCHLVVADLDVCHEKCTQEYGNPCQHFCPAAVYEMEPNADGADRLKINASNCVHCKTCDIMDPYQIINWVTPEGGGGPAYQLL